MKETVTESLEVGNVFVFLGENVSRVAGTGDVGDRDLVKVDRIADRIFADIEMAEAFGRHGGGPVNTTLVVVVNRCRKLDIRKA
jgi:hypothetical protein